MAKKNVLMPYQFINAQSMGATFTSAVTTIAYLDNISLQLSWTSGSTPIGVFTVEVSSDYVPGLNSGTWVDLGVSPALTVSGNSGSLFIDLNQLGAMYIRVVYTRTSGSATCNGYISGKSLSG